MKLSSIKLTNRFMTTGTRQIHQSFNPKSSKIFENRTANYLISRALLFKILGNQTVVNFAILILQGRQNIYNGSLKLLIKRTIFPIFCGGENVSDCLSLADKLHREENITSIVGLSVNIM